MRLSEGEGTLRKRRSSDLYASAPFTYGLAARSPRMIHYLKRTDQVVETGENRKGVDRIRRACSIKADGCYSFGYLGMPKKTMFECANKNCMKSQKRANRHTTKGVFICQNELCLAKHRRDMCGE